MIPISRTSKIVEAILDDGKNELTYEQMREILSQNLKFIEKHISRILGIKTELSLTNPIGMGIGIVSDELKPKIQKLILSSQEILQQIIVREFLSKIESAKVTGHIGVSRTAVDNEYKFIVSFIVETNNKNINLRDYYGELSKTTNTIVAV